MKRINTLLLVCSLVTNWGICQANESDDVVQIKVTTANYDATKPPVIAPVKYNKLCPLVITSDDMGRGEYMRNWAYFNGYPVIADSYAGQMDDPMTLLNAPYNAGTLAHQDAGIAANSFAPLTYTDGTGGLRRFTATSAIMPYKIGGNYTLINEEMAKIMVRTGWSFAQHDVADNFNGVEDVNAYIKEQLHEQSLKMQNLTGYGLKVIVEPNGDHRYITAGIESEEICWNIFQNSDTDYPALSLFLEDWKRGTDITDFSNKPTGAFERMFFQGNESTWIERINAADGTTMILGGTHGIGNDILLFMKELAVGGTSDKADKFWVAGADEVWEYYHLYNHAKIENISYADGVLTFDVRMPQYAKHQFRELTINIPGITEGSGCQFSDNVVTGSARQNTEYYTVNFGIETGVRTHIEELITLYRENLTNDYIKRDAQYLINLLPDGDRKTNYQQRLDAAPNYSLTLNAILGNSGNQKQLFSTVSDEQAETTCPFPRYILDNNTLYQTTANDNTPHYVRVITPSSANETVNINYTAIDNADVVFYSEGEDLEGTTPITDVINATKKGTGEPYHALMQASNGIGGALKNGTVTITTLQPGIYTLVAGIGDTWHDANHYATFTFKLGEKTICNFETDTYGVKEYVKEDIIVKTGQPLTVSALETGNARWLDYVYLKKQADYDLDTPDIDLISTNNSRIKTSDGETQVTLTATATPHEGYTISNIVIKDWNGNVLASSNETTCSYVFSSSTLGTYKFSAEGTDDTGRKGVSDELTVSVCSDLSYTVTANTGDILFSTSYSDQTEAKNIIYTFPRHLLKGTELYEAERNNTNAADVTNENKASIQPHYGENMVLSTKGVTRTVKFTKKRENIVSYIEGEDIAGIEVKRGSISNSKGDGELYWTYFLASNGAGGHIKTNNTKVCDLPAGTYQLTAGIGDSWNNDTHYGIFTFKLNDTQVLEAKTTKDKTVEEFTSDSFTVPEGGGTITVSASNSGNARWLDYLYIQKTGTTPVQIGTIGYATYSSPYALDFTSSGLKVYKATIGDNQVLLTDVTGAIPSQTGLFIQGRQGEAISRDIPLLTSSQTAEAIANNDLRPHTDGGKVAAGNYVFSGTRNGENLAFRKLQDDTDVPAGRAYLHDGSSGTRKNLLTIMTDDNTTVIEKSSWSTSSNQAEAPLYNLQGMRVDRRYQGIIVKKGKLHIVNY